MNAAEALTNCASELNGDANLEALAERVAGEAVQLMPSRREVRCQLLPACWVCCQLLPACWVSLLGVLASLLGVWCWMSLLESFILHAVSLCMKLCLLDMLICWNWQAVAAYGKALKGNGKLDEAHAQLEHVVEMAPYAGTRALPARHCHCLPIYRCHYHSHCYVHWYHHHHTTGTATATATVTITITPLALALPLPLLPSPSYHWHWHCYYHCYQHCYHHYHTTGTA